MCESVKRNRPLQLFAFRCVFLLILIRSCFIFSISTCLSLFRLCSVFLDLKRQFLFVFVSFVQFCAALLYHKSYRAVTYSYVWAVYLYVSILILTCIFVIYLFIYVFEMSGSPAALYVLRSPDLRGRVARKIELEQLL